MRKLRATLGPLVLKFWENLRTTSTETFTVVLIRPDCVCIYTSANFRLFSFFAATLALTSGDGSKGTSVLAVISFMESIFLHTYIYTASAVIFDMVASVKEEYSFGFPIV